MTEYTKFLAICQFYWDKGTTRRSAIANMRKQGADRDVRYVVVRCTADAYVDQLGRITGMDPADEAQLTAWARDME